MPRFFLARFATLPALALIAFPTALKAQDVTIGNIVWTGPGPAPDTLPASKNKLRPEYPSELSKTSEVGYVIVSRRLDANGKSLSLSAQGTHVPFQRSVEVAFEDWAVKPAKRGEQPVDAEIWLPVIFNPKSAASNGTNTTPRLLEVTLVNTPVPPTSAGKPPVVRMRVSLDAGGTVTQATPEATVPERVLDSIQSELKNWRFAPARQNGQPVAAELVVSVLCRPPTQPDRTPIVPAKLISRSRPEYPIVMRRFGIRGQVMVDFVVDASGKVRSVVVVESDNPAFEEAALKSVLEWKFEPATRGGKPIEVHQRVPIVFTLDGGGESAFHVEEHGDQSKLPPELRFDTPPKIRSVLIPVYPYVQRRDGIRGMARASVLIDQQGRVTAVKLLAADQPEFGLALTAALEGYAFDPALKDGKPVLHLMKFEQTFDARELPDDTADNLLSDEKKHPERIVGATALDATPKPLSRRPPRFPTGLEPGITHGEAVIECLIDQGGRVRLPRIVSASDPAFGYAAVQAVAAWWFEPPKAGGKATAVRVRIPINFNDGPPKKPAARSPELVNPAK